MLTELAAAIANNEPETCRTIVRCYCDTWSPIGLANAYRQLTGQPPDTTWPRLELEKQYRLAWNDAEPQRVLSHSRWLVEQRER